MEANGGTHGELDGARIYNPVALGVHPRTTPPQQACRLEAPGISKVLGRHFRVGGGCYGDFIQSECRGGTEALEYLSAMAFIRGS